MFKVLKKEARAAGFEALVVTTSSGMQAILGRGDPMPKRRAHVVPLGTMQTSALAAGEGGAPAREAWCVQVRDTRTGVWITAKRFPREPDARRYAAAVEHIKGAGSTLVEHVERDVPKSATLLREVKAQEAPAAQAPKKRLSKAQLRRCKASQQQS